MTRTTRRQLLQTGVYGLGLGAAAGLGLPPLFGRTAAAARVAPRAADNGRILVVVELSGGNDGLNTLVPYGDDAYYGHRPALGLKPDRLRKIDDHFGFSPGMAGFERLYKDGRLAVVHGCGYENPSFSHFTSMAYWHTGAPNSGNPYGWVGRTADVLRPGGEANYIVNIDRSQSLAVRSRDHVPVVFDDPNGFGRNGFHAQQDLLRQPVALEGVVNESHRFLRTIARSAQDASVLVRRAWDAYDSTVDYGLADLDLRKVAALIQADMPTRLYYTAFRNNAFTL